MALSVIRRLLTCTAYQSAYISSSFELSGLSPSDSFETEYELILLLAESLVGLGNFEMAKVEYAKLLGRITDQNKSDFVRMKMIQLLVEAGKNNTVQVVENVWEEVLTEMEMSTFENETVSMMLLRCVALEKVGRKREAAEAYLKLACQMPSVIEAAYVGVSCWCEFVELDFAGFRMPLQIFLLLFLLIIIKGKINCLLLQITKMLLYLVGRESGFHYMFFLFFNYSHILD